MTAPRTPSHSKGQATLCSGKRPFGAFIFAAPPEPPSSGQTAYLFIQASLKTMHGGASRAFSRGGGNHRFAAGFSFVEVIIVTLLLGIMAVAGLPALSSSLDNTSRSTATSEVVTALEFAQLTAASTGRQTRVTIDAAADTILVEQLTYSSDILTGGAILAEATVENASFTAMQYPLKRGTDYNINLANESRFNGVDITAVDFNSNNFVTYDALGTPSSSGTVDLSLGGVQSQVTVDGLTGKVVVTN